MWRGTVFDRTFFHLCFLCYSPWRKLKGYVRFKNPTARSADFAIPLFCGSCPTGCSAFPKSQRSAYPTSRTAPFRSGSQKRRRRVRANTSNKGVGTVPAVALAQSGASLSCWKVERSGYAHTLRPSSILDRAYHLILF